MWLCCLNAVLPVSQSFAKLFPLSHVPYSQHLSEEACRPFHFCHTWESTESLRFLTEGGNCSLPLSMKLLRAFFMSNIFNLRLFGVLNVYTN